MAPVASAATATANVYVNASDECEQHPGMAHCQVASRDLSDAADVATDLVQHPGKIYDGAVDSAVGAIECMADPTPECVRRGFVGVAQVAIGGATGLATKGVPAAISGGVKKAATGAARVVTATAKRVLPAAKVALTGTARKAQEIALSTTMRVGRLAEGATGKALPTISRGPSRIKGLSLDDQAALASRHVGGLSSKQAKSILQVARNGENPSSVVFGGSRVRGNFGPGSDVDIGFGHLNKNQARKRLSKIRHDAAKNGGLVPGEYQIVPNRAVTGHAPISTPEEFFQRSGIRVQEDGFEAFGPSGSITFDVDGTVTIWPPVH